MDFRSQKLAKQIVNYSLKLKKNEKVMILMKNKESFDFLEVLLEEIYRAGALPFIRLSDSKVDRAYFKGAKQDQFEFEAKIDLSIMKQMNAYIRMEAMENPFEMSDVPVDTLKLHSKINKPVLDWRIKKTKWCVLRWPTSSFAQSAEMTTENFKDFYFKACLVDYAKMSKAMDVLVRLLNKTDKVEIKGPHTDLSFSIKNIPAVKCDGHLNIPDGEVFTAPIKTSVNGKLFMNAPTMYQGQRFAGIHFEFKDGKIINASCDQGSGKELNKILDSDTGSRFIGEFAIGINPHITKTTFSTLFDEKIAGSFHFTPGQCYDEAPNGNNSQIHWDIVNIQTPQWGGGEIYFDNKLIRKNGKFTKELEMLNPEKLK